MLSNSSLRVVSLVRSALPRLIRMEEGLHHNCALAFSYSISEFIPTREFGLKPVLVDTWYPTLHCHQGSSSSVPSVTDMTSGLVFESQPEP